MKKPFLITYDKHVLNKYGGHDVERVTIEADTKDVAMRRMKEDVYKNGCYGGSAVAFMPNGKKLHFKATKKPTLTTTEKIQSPILCRVRHRDFGADKPKIKIEKDGLCKFWDEK